MALRSLVASFLALSPAPALGEAPFLSAKGPFELSAAGELSPLPCPYFKYGNDFEAVKGTIQKLVDEIVGNLHVYDVFPPDEDQAPADGRIGSAVVNDIKIDILLDASESLDGENDKQRDIVNMLEDALTQKMEDAKQEAEKQILAKYKEKFSKEAPEHPHPEITGILTSTKGYFNSKFKHKETPEEAVSFEDMRYTGQGDWKKALELCNSDMNEMHLDGTIKSRRLTNFGKSNDKELEMKEPKRICAIITDDQAMCDKDKEPEGAGDVGNIETCTALAKQLKGDDIHIVVLSKSPSAEAARLGNAGYMEFVNALGCDNKNFQKGGGNFTTIVIVLLVVLGAVAGGFAYAQTMGRQAPAREGAPAVELSSRT